MWNTQRNTMHHNTTQHNNHTSTARAKHIQQQLLMYLLLQFKCQMQLELCQNYCKIFLQQQLKNQQKTLPIIRPCQISVLNYYSMACFNRKVLEPYDAIIQLQDTARFLIQYPYYSRLFLKKKYYSTTTTALICDTLKFHLKNSLL